MADQYTDSDVIAQFKDAMRDCGIEPPKEIVGDGCLHRFKIGSSHKANGAYVLHIDERPAGHFRDWKKGIFVNWKMEGDFTPFTPEQRRDYAEKCRKQEAQRKADEVLAHQDAARKAAYIWGKCGPAPANHPYLVRKCIDPHDARLGRHNLLVIPIYNANFKLVNLQFIAEDGTKRFLKGGQIQDCFYRIGRKVTQQILVCEGFATGASLHEDSGHMVYVALASSILKQAIIVVKSLHMDKEIIICADFDEHGIGEETAEEAAVVIGGQYVLPARVGHDFNDMLTQEGRCKSKGGVFDEYCRRGAIIDCSQAKVTEP